MQINSKQVKFNSDNLVTYDYIAIGGYFLAILIIGIWSSIKSKNDSVKNYFLAGRDMSWFLVGASLFASNIGSGHFVGLAGSGSNSGIAIAAFEMNAIFILLLLGWIFIPVYFSSEVYTMPEYLKRRFGGKRIRIYLSCLSLLLYIFTKISADLYAGALFIRQSLGFNLYFSVGILLTLAAIFTIAGGLTAVMWTELLQTVLMLAGAVTLMIYSLKEIGGYEEVIRLFPFAVPTNSSYVKYDKNNVSCSKVTEYYFNIFRPLDDKDMPWLGAIFGLTITSIWYWCADQVIVQRALSAKNISHAKGGCILAATLKFSPLFLLVIPGMISRILWPELVACSNPDKCHEICESRAGCSNIAYPLLVLNVMPEGATGLMLSVMMASLMASLTSIFNSSSTIFTVDIWKRIRKNAGEVEQVIVGRIFVVILVFISILWIPFIQDANGSQLFHYMNSVSAYLVPPVGAVFILGILWERINEEGAFWGLIIGLIVGMVRFIWEYAHPLPMCGEEDTKDPSNFFLKMHYLYFGIILFIISSLSTILISLATKPFEPKYLYRLTFWTRFSEKPRLDLDKKVETKSSLRNNGIYNVGFKESPEDSEIQVVNHHKKKSNYNINTQKEKNDFNWLYFLCCMKQQDEDVDNKPTDRLSEEEKAKQAADSVKEGAIPSALCNIAAIFIVGAACYYHGLFTLTPQVGAYNTTLPLFDATSN